MTKRVWLAILLVGAMLAPAHALAPDAAVDAAYLVVAVLAAALLAVAIVRRPLARRGAWIALLVGVATAIGGDLLWVWYAARGIDPFPSPADAAYLASYPAYALGLWWLGRRARPTDRAALVDACILAVAGLVLSWTYLLEPPLTDSSLTLFGRVVSLAYPLGDLIVLPLIARLVFVHGARVRSHLLVLGSMVAMLVADVAFGIGFNNGWYVDGGPLDGLWLLAYVLLAAAAWHPSAAHDPPPLGRISSGSRRRLIALAFVSLLAPLVLLIHEPPRTSVGWVAGAGSILLFLLVVGRMIMLVEQVNDQSVQLEQLSLTDPLTGAANRRALDEAITQAIARVDRGAPPYAFAMLDLDHFKDFNDTHGHLAGDALLREAVMRWQSQLREVDVLARYGGEEFAILLPDTDADAALVVVERLRSVVPDGQTCSAGVTLAGPGATQDSIVRAADDALYAAKAAGRDRTAVADGIDQADGSPRQI
ncbi:MAG TPA: GGDEF domain-containing protein [Egicoccus sp.]|nr:GGDEF domain-containing protein [Egicoccus sp.]HSK22007.1 GGDEF domain-containing protein [Egicoccus sp.]